MSHPKGVEDRSGDLICKDEAGSPTGRGQVQGTDVGLHGPPNSVVNSMADWDGWAVPNCRLELFSAIDRADAWIRLRDAEGQREGV